MEERWRESLRTQDAHAYLSTIVLLGSILEGVLFCKILKNSNDAIKSNCVPKDKGSGDKLPIEKWMLDAMINVCHDRGWIDGDVSKFSHAVKEYRNFVHPYQQLKSKLKTPKETTCKAARVVIEGALRSVLKNP